MPLVKILPRAERHLLFLPPELQDEIMHKIGSLEDFPEMGTPMEKAYKDYRFLLAGRNRYRIIYKVIQPDLVEIAYIRHCRRQMSLKI